MNIFLHFGYFTVLVACCALPPQYMFFGFGATLLFWGMAIMIVEDRE